MAQTAPQRLLMIRPDAYGDLVLFEPALRALRAAWKHTEIGVLIREQYADITPLLTPGIRWLTTKCDPYRKPAGADPGALEALGRDVAAFGPDCVVAACYDKTWLEAAVAAAAPGARQVGLGPYCPDLISRIVLQRTMSIDWAGIYGETVAVERDSSDWEKNLQLARHLLGKEVPRDLPAMIVPEAAREQAAGLVAAAGLSPGGFVACCPGGNANVTIKVWPAERYGHILGWLEKEHGIRALLLGHEQERDTLHTVERFAREAGAAPAIWTGTDGQIALLAGLLQQSRLYFGNDTGALHFAGALDKPVAGIFGGGHWPRFKSLARRAVCLVQPLPCFGCHWECSFGDAPCVKTIGPEAVRQALGHVLASNEEERKDLLVDDGVTSAERELMAKVAARANNTRQIKIGDAGGGGELFSRAALEQLLVQLEVSEADRAARLESIQRLEQSLAESEQDRAARLGVIQQAEAQLTRLQAESESLRARLAEVQHQLESSETDRAARLEAMQRLEQLLRESEQDRTARLGVLQQAEARLTRLQAEGESSNARLAEVQHQLEASETDRVARLESIQRLEQLLRESEQDRAARLGVLQQAEAQLARLQAEGDSSNARLAEVQHRLELSETDRAVTDRRVEELNSLTTQLRMEITAWRQRSEASEAQRQQTLKETEAQRERLDAGISYWKAHGEEMQTTLHRVGNSQTYRVARALGQWRWLEHRLGAEAGSGPVAPGSGNGKSAKALRRVVVDMTPVLPGAENGGAKLVATELVRHLARLAPSCEWILLTSEKGHDDLAWLDARNVRRVRVSHIEAGPAAAKQAGRAGKNSKLKKRRDRAARSGVLARLDPDLFFCPFPTARFFDPRVPMVAIVYDLQHAAYPEFFSPQERGHRERQFRDVCRFAARLVCISEHTRQDVLRREAVDPSQVTTIHVSLFGRLADCSMPDGRGGLREIGLQPGRFLLYPANYWPHKNHEMLLTAFGMYRARHPGSDLKLVCTGGLSGRRAFLHEAAERMGLGDWTRLLEFVPDEQFSALLRACGAVVYPSLFEGFGMPLLEAMAHDKPVLCSNATCLPEIAGDAALLFDPRNPEEILAAIERIESNPGLAAHLAGRGRERLKAFSDAPGMAQRYLEIFQEALDGNKPFAPAIHGVFSDGWTGESITVLHEAGAERRYLEITLHAPAWLPAKELRVRLVGGGSNGPETHEIRRGQTVTLRHALPAAGGSVEVEIGPTFQPQALQMGTDTRFLGCQCRSCRILSPDQSVNLFAGEPVA